MPCRENSNSLKNANADFMCQSPLKLTLIQIMRNLCRYRHLLVLLANAAVYDKVTTTNLYHGDATPCTNGLKK